MKSIQLFENILSLVGLKGIEYILNFVLYPFLLRVLGAEKFGMIAFMQGVIQYFIIIVDYGFNMTGPKSIAQAKSKAEIGVIFSNIMAAKFILLLLVTSISVIMGIIGTIYFQWNVILFIAVYVMVIGNFIFPVWFFQGIQEMKYITLFNVIARLIILVLIFCVIKTPDDYVWAAFFQSSMLGISGIISFYVLMIKYRYIFVKPTWNEIIKTIKNGWHIFFSTIAINIYTTTNVVVLGALTTDSIVGYFSAANKLIDCAKGLMIAITQAVYPYVSNKISQSIDDTIDFLRLFLKSYCGLCGIGSIILFFFAEWIVRFLFGDEYMSSIIILKTMAFLPFIISISNVFGVQLMLNWGKQRAFSKILSFAAIIDCCIVVPLTSLYSSEGIAITMLVTEGFVTACTIVYVYWYMKIRLF